MKENTSTIEESARLPSIISWLLEVCASVGRATLYGAQSVGACTLFILKFLMCLFTKPFYFKQLLDGLLNIGFYSVPLIGMTAVFTGAVLALQSYTGFSRFSAEDSIPTVVVLSITRELGPVLTGLMVAGRISSSIAAEIATMRVTEQVDALVTMSVDPIRYLVVPRVLAGLIVFPLLTLLADSIGILGGYAVATDVLSFNKVAYLRNTMEYLEKWDVVSGLIKSVIFGFIVTMCGCYIGISSERGARGVGLATINSVVAASILILLFNYLTTSVLFDR
jgi:phospholipid/cholesterol/gamma-HCH transport system permease protein